MIYFYSSLILVGLLFFCGLIAYPYFPHVNEVSPIWHMPEVHAGLALGLSSLIITLLFVTPLTRTYLLRRWRHEPRASLYLDVFFVVLFVPSIASIPLAHSLNRNLDFQPPKKVSLKISQARFIQKGVLETRRCQIEGKIESGEELTIKYRPIDDVCIFNNEGAVVSLFRHQGLFGRHWVKFNAQADLEKETETRASQQ